jgi:hypothetical protein
VALRRAGFIGNAVIVTVLKEYLVAAAWVANAYG